MKRITKITLFALGLVVLGGLAGIVPGLPSLAGAQAVVEAATQHTITLDVACDCRTFKFNRGVPRDQVLQGDGFLTKGKIFPAGTLRPGAQTNDPNDPGSIGSWVCRGQTAHSTAEIIAGAPHPFLFFTQYHMLNDGRTLVSDGFDGGGSAVIGGIGGFSGASGEISAVEIGTNITQCPNIRFTIHLKKQEDD